ncbi:hypothetical protein ACTXT7_016062 [Hymenolepis weldensis]
MVECQNTARLKTAIVPNNCHVDQERCAPGIDKGDEQFGDDLPDLIIPRQNSNSTALGFHNLDNFPFYLSSRKKFQRKGIKDLT